MLIFYHSTVYHIVARREKELLLFETDYNHIDIANIHSVKSNKASLCSLPLLKGEGYKLAIIEKLDKLGFDSIIITKDDLNNFRIDIMKTDCYEKFINE